MANDWECAGCVPFLMGLDMKNNILAIIFCFFLVPQIGVTDDVHSVSLMSLVVTPEKYVGKDVDVIGYASISLESNVLWFHREDALTGNVMNAVWLDVGKIVDVEKYDGKYIQLIGTFTLKSGHMGMYPGSILVDRIKVKEVK